MSLSFNVLHGKDWGGQLLSHNWKETDTSIDKYTYYKVLGYGCVAKIYLPLFLFVLTQKYLSLIHI